MTALAAMKQALEALEYIKRQSESQRTWGGTEWRYQFPHKRIFDRSEEAITNLRAAIEAVEKAEPLHVGDSSFESWFQSQSYACHGVKQIARDAYAAGMGDHLTRQASSVEKSEPSVWLNFTTKDCTFDPRIKDNWIQQGHVVKSYYKHPAPAVPEGPTFEESKGNCLRAAHGGID